VKKLKNRLADVAAERRELQEAIDAARRQYDEHRRFSQETIEAMQIAEMTEKWDAMRAGASAASSASGGAFGGGGGGSGDGSGSGGGGGAGVDAGTDVDAPQTNAKPKAADKSRSTWLSHDRGGAGAGGAGVNAGVDVNAPQTEAKSKKAGDKSRSMWLTYDGDLSETGRVDKHFSFTTFFSHWSKYHIMMGVWST
jgi:hypothetical protein